ncbi:hypothetical protein RGQ29_020218 [Quercus rubra]|uniref:Uncharacterized protein n=1 Tax=Quercus rubra TaxID=3512 RepID=A0AAN7FET5_QUERU|nr:hypothetical protein RGQ29_020218 [Quercus rubra]
MLQPLIMPITQLEKLNISQQPLMNAEEVTKLLDYCWFEGQIFTKQPNLSKPLSFEASPDNEIQEKPSEPEVSRISTLHTRSMSNQLSSKTTFGYGSLSPNSVLLIPKLDTIFSGKEVIESETPKQRDFEVLSSKKKVKSRARKRKSGESKSLSDLEFEELKGFMDLGFVFSEEDRNSSLASVIPGLHRLGKKDDKEEAVDESTIPRPYLSEAWEVLDERKRENRLMNFRVPFPALNNETRMKDTLRLWAHTVASTVR